MNSEKVMSFIDQVEADRMSEIENDKFMNSIDYKYKMLDKAKCDAKNQCLSRVFEKFYRNSVPLNDEYKRAYNDELNNDVDDFVKGRGAENLSYYVGEARKRGCKAACSIMEAVDNIVDSHFRDKELNLDDYKPEDLVFKMDDDTQKKIDVVGQDLELDDLSQIIANNVKSTATSEIMRAKKEKENAKALEIELANDINVTNESAIDFELELRGMKEKKFFQPSLFEGIMIGKLNKETVLRESGMTSDTYLYGALEDYGMVNESTFASPEEVAFVESVREYTMLNIAKALKLEKFTLSDMRELAQDYATK